jgi:hypothetical protein
MNPWSLARTSMKIILNLLENFIALPGELVNTMLDLKGKQFQNSKPKKENLDIRTLDQGHVIPNMKDPTLRGVWFPLGYD